MLVGQGNIRNENVTGRHGMITKNPEGQMEVDFSKRMNLTVANTYFQKKEEHQVTYKSVGRTSR